MGCGKGWGAKGMGERGRGGGGVGEGRAHSLASVRGIGNSCYLLRAGPRSNKYLLGASRVPGTVPGTAE